MVIVLVAALAGGAGAIALRPGETLAAVRSVTGAVDHPRRLPSDRAAAPLGLPPAPPRGTGGFRMLHLQDGASGDPVRWDPCRPVHVVVRADGAVPGGPEAVAAALADVAGATGLRFVVEGTTNEQPRPNRPPMDVARYGDRWSPVLVAWTDPNEYPDMRGFAGLGGPTLVEGARPGTARYVSGVVLLNRAYLGDLATWEGGRQRMAAIVRHEVAHVAGLDHVSDVEALMNPRPNTPPHRFADGDLRGLAALGAGRCYTDY